VKPIEHVVLADPWGRPAGTVPKALAHSAATPLHLAFSVHVVGPDDRVLLTRRAATKRTWPGVWSNACCGHPQDGESLRQAVCRRLGQELGVHPTRLAMAIPDFAYRAAMDDGTVEHELCPVVIAHVEDEPRPEASEVDAVEWVTWADLRDRAAREPASLSPWSVAQVTELEELGWEPQASPRLGGALLEGFPLASRLGHVSADVDVLAPVDAPLRAVLDAFLDERAVEQRLLDPALDDVVDEIRALVDAGGKRLRPAFVHWGHRAAGGLQAKRALLGGAAVELLHTFALLHDDVMDRSPHRRGRPSAHAAFAARHRALGHDGDSAHFGNSAAVLAGDLAFVWADDLFDRALPGPHARRVFSTLRTEVMAGQYLDLLLATGDGASEHAARRVALLKSARYTVTRPLELGAALSGFEVDPHVLDALRTYGDAVGLAFQLRDDILGLFGDPDRTGKGCLEDLREGKRTLLVLRALRLADEQQRRLLTDALGDPTLDADRAADACAVIADTGALASVELLLRAQHQLAIDATCGLPEPAGTALRALASLAIERSQ
jgi:geranylgeranyl diphosphate synthase type I